jgi:hypothetical protein
LHEPPASLDGNDESRRDWQAGGQQLAEMSRFAADARQILETNRGQRHREYALPARAFQSVHHCLLDSGWPES